MLQTSHHIVFNSSSGTAASASLRPEQLIERFAALGHVVSMDADKSRPFAERMQTARSAAAPILVAAGGDGTVTALAEAAIQSGKTLAVIPLGTANLLARDLAIPLDLDAWFAGYPDMAPRRIDVGEVNGRVFLHKVVIGAVPGIAAAREQLRGRKDLGALLGFLSHFFYRLSRVRRFAAEITPGKGEPHIERVQSIAVANNDYAEGPGKVFSRARLDEGTLSLYLLRHLSPLDALRLGFGMLIGSWRNDQVLEIENVRSVVIRTQRRGVRAMLDGEVEMLQGPLRFRSLPLALNVLAPPVPEAQAIAIEVVGEV
ncbi:diacylglycerol/lipid kinase family protein [Devosia sp. CN2-171]|uniref:diacylglycerol/lipid kinase family protein n=1 Tax=Devosia sp. CN2-171 TaxID=3400909 RepID=UPI003BF789B2